MIFKLLIFIIILGLIYNLFFKNSRGQVTPPPKKKSKKKNIDSDTMVECAKCSVFISEKDAIIKDGRFYCSTECAGVG